MKKKHLLKDHKQCSAMHAISIRYTKFLFRISLYYFILIKLYNFLTASYNSNAELIDLKVNINLISLKCTGSYLIMKTCTHQLLIYQLWIYETPVHPTRVEIDFTPQSRTSGRKVNPYHLILICNPYGSLDTLLIDFQTCIDVLIVLPWPYTQTCLGV